MAKAIHGYTTNTGHPLTPGETHFIDRYIETNNGQQSYIDAYPNSNPKNARQNAYRLLNKIYITEEINYRLQQSKKESIANREEILEFFTKGMRGEMKDQFGLEMSQSDRLKFATELAKRTMDIEDRLASKGQEQPELKITLDFARPTQAVQLVARESIENTEDSETAENVDNNEEGTDE